MLHYPIKPALSITFGNYVFIKLRIEFLLIRLEHTGIILFISYIHSFLIFNKKNQTLFIIELKK